MTAPADVSSGSIPGIRLHVSEEQTTTLEADSGNVRSVLFAVVLG